MAAFSNPVARFATLIGLALFVTLAATGCGRKGALYLPSSADVAPANDDRQDGNTKSESQEKPDRPFVLDPLL